MLEIIKGSETVPLLRHLNELFLKKTEKVVDIKIVYI